VQSFGRHDDGHPHLADAVPTRVRVLQTFIIIIVYYIVAAKTLGGHCSAAVSAPAADKS